ncbi:MAG: hypothetical protein PHI53_01720 [Candidatus Pacebacteria bacterium]|nr:hypothetical protein [Candidatus Paceibacterota bacterium]
MNSINRKAWVVSIDMGYGHQRTAYTLRDFAFSGRVIRANNYEGMPKEDKRIWHSTREFYEFISRFKKIPLAGDLAFSLFDRFQEIPSFYPKRDLSKPSLFLKRISKMIKKGWGRDLISKLKDRNSLISSRFDRGEIPFITTFFTPAFMAESFNYPGEIFCVICDADISRSWAPILSSKSRIKYLAPNSWVVNRLKLYGVKDENIFLTGFPLPTENIGTENMELLKNDISYRILNLDPEARYRHNYKFLINEYIGDLPDLTDHPLTILFSIGGAGSQKELVAQYIKNLKEEIKNKKIKIILSAGIREEVKRYFLKIITDFGLGKNVNDNIEIIFEKEIYDYFYEFNQRLKETDILWTKPSELSFYCGLGLPIIIAPSIGSQEDLNRKWLLRTGAGIIEEDPKYAREWLFDYINSGRFAEAAMQGFIETEKLGVYNISKVCFGSNENH